MSVVETLASYVWLELLRLKILVVMVGGNGRMDETVCNSARQKLLW